MVIVGIIELRVLSSVEFDGEQWINSGDGGVGEEAEVLAGEGAGRIHGVGEDEGEAEAGAGGDLGQDGEYEGGGEGGDVGGIGGGFHGELGGEEGSAEGVLIGVVGHADDGVVDAGVVDEGEVGAIGEAGEGIKEEVECGDGREEEEADDEKQRGFHHAGDFRHCHRHRRGKDQVCLCVALS